ICTVNDMRCNENTVELCTQSGWEPQSTCSPDNTCTCSVDQLTGLNTCRCIPRNIFTCSSPNDMRCNGNEIEICTQSGWWESRGTCPPDNPCGCVVDPATGLNTCSCNPLCQPLNDMRCNGNVVELCTRFGWQSQFFCFPDNPCGCVVDPATGLHTCSCNQANNPNFCQPLNDMRCNENAVEICTQSGWEPQSTCSPDNPCGCVVDQLTGLKTCNCGLACNDSEYICDNSKLLQCVNGNFFELEDCADSNLICDSINKKCACPPGSSEPICDGPDSIKYCQDSPDRGEWLKYPCTMGYCQNGKCYCNPGSAYCKDDLTFYSCNAQGEWTEEKCPAGTACFQGECVECASSSGDFSYCKDEKTLVRCINKKLSYFSCPEGTFCKIIDENTATCEGTGQAPMDNPPAQGGNIGGVSGGGGGGSGSSGSGGSSSGGGEITRKCYGWSDWFINATEEKTDPTSPSLVCVNTTYIRWCKTSKGELDFSIFEKKSEYKCGEKSQKEVCNYEYSGSSTYTDYINGECRTCSKDTSIYTCYPSGKKDETKQKTSVSCGLWRACTEEEKAKFQKKEAQPPPEQPQSDMLLAINKAFEQYGGIVLLVFFLLIAGFAFYLFWKFYGEGKKKEDEIVQ
ncbi:MAG: hypothetical protein ACK4J0_01195, partial [Candidatus Anstonellaceae archaeon]